MDGDSDKSVVVAEKSVMFSGQQQQTYHFASFDDKKICPALSEAPIIGLSNPGQWNNILILTILLFHFLTFVDFSCDLC